MATGMRFVAVLLVVSVGLTLVIALAQWSRRIDLDAQRIGRQERASALQEPPAEVERVTRRIFAKGRVVDQLLSNELDLFGAAACFRDLNQEAPECKQPEGWRQGKTEEERLCRQVIEWAEARGREYLDPDELEWRFMELEAVLADRLREGERFTLP